MKDTLSLIYGVLSMVPRMRETGASDNRIIDAIVRMVDEMKPLIDPEKASQLDAMFDGLIADFKAGKGQFSDGPNKNGEGKKLFG